MAGNLAEKQINKAVGWGFYPNSNNLVLHEAETRMNSGIAGGGAATSKPERLSGTRSVLIHRETAEEVQSTPIPSSRNSFYAIYHICRLAGSQTKIRHKLKYLCENI